MRSVNLEGAARLAAPLYLSLLAGFILGFELAWLLMKCTWLDMRFPGEAAIPAGILLGLGGGVWCRLRPPRPPALRRLLWLQMAGGLPLLYAAASAPRAFWQTAPILFRQALGLPPLPPLAFWIPLSAVLLLGLMLHRRQYRLRLQVSRDRSPA